LAEDVAGLANVGGGVSGKSRGAKGIQLAVLSDRIVGVAGVAGETREDGLAVAGQTPRVAPGAAAGHLVEAGLAGEAVHVGSAVAGETGHVAVPALVAAEVGEELVGEAGAATESAVELEACDAAGAGVGHRAGAGCAGLEAAPAGQSRGVFVETDSAVLDAEAA
jgi:hypothetical protein